MTHIPQNNGRWSGLPGDSVWFPDMASVPTGANDPYRPRTFRALVLGHALRQRGHHERRRQGACRAAGLERGRSAAVDQRQPVRLARTAGRRTHRPGVSRHPRQHPPLRRHRGKPDAQAKDALAEKQRGIRSFYGFN